MTTLADALFTAALCVLLAIGALTVCGCIEGVVRVVVAAITRER